LLSRKHEVLNKNSVNLTNTIARDANIISRNNPIDTRRQLFPNLALV